MNKRNCSICTLVLSLAVLWGWHTISANSNSRQTNPTAPAPGELVVHEWGTFTTFSGSDGVYLDFRPFAQQKSDLPDYVLDRGAFSSYSLISKNRIRGRVRMETPIIYFYTDEVRTVDVQVDFPDGLLTEFYPPATKMLPELDPKNIFGQGERIGNSSLQWSSIDLIPLQSLVLDTVPQTNRDQLVADMVESLLPHGPNEQHYAEARGTDSALVHARGQAGYGAKEKGFFEKFLFYRGVGKFELPIKATFSDKTVHVANNGDQPIHSAILIDVDGKDIRAEKISEITQQSTADFSKAAPVTEEELATMVQDCLVAEGLYSKEAAAMVNTWRNSWFTENGTRILYIVPPVLTEKLLPLTISPAPDQSIRVLVGRMELMSPSAEQKMIAAVKRSAQQRAVYNAEIRKSGKKKAFPIPKEIEQFGRMTEPALVRVHTISSDDLLRREAELLVQQIQRSN